MYTESAYRIILIRKETNRQFLAGVDPVEEVCDHLVRYGQEADSIFNGLVIRQLILSDLSRFENITTTRLMET